MTNAPSSPLERLADTLNSQLDANYLKIVTPVLKGIATDPRVASALAAFQKRAAELANTNQQLTEDDPALGNLRSAIELSLTRQTSRIDVAGAALQAGAVGIASSMARQMALPGVSNQHLNVLGIQWKQPQADVVNQLVNYTNSKAWADQLDQYGPDVAQKVANVALLGVVDGQGPRQIASDVTAAVDAIPRSEAEQLMRTLQLTSYRQASTANYVANADIVDHCIRVEALDDRTCIPCIFLNGTELEVGETPDEHENGRAVAVPVVKGFERDIQSGEDWLDGLGEDRQRKIMGDANYNAWSAGEVQLGDFVQHRVDPLFGPMIREASLKGLLGDKAKQYYKVNYGK